jgi:hypothetical protein
MGFLSKILNREQTPAKSEPITVVCPHTILIPHWDNIDDMGKEDLATSFACQSCSETFTAEEAKEVRATAMQKLLNV